MAGDAGPCTMRYLMSSKYARNAAVSLSNALAVWSRVLPLHVRSMFLRQLDLTTALRPSLLPDETLLFVQDSVGLYEG